MGSIEPRKLNHSSRAYNGKKECDEKGQGKHLQKSFLKMVHEYVRTVPNMAK